MQNAGHFVQASIYLTHWGQVMHLCIGNILCRYNIIRQNWVNTGPVLTHLHDDKSSSRQTHLSLFGSTRMPYMHHTRLFPSLIKSALAEPQMAQVGAMEQSSTIIPHGTQPLPVDGKRRQKWGHR